MKKRNFYLAFITSLLTFVPTAHANVSSTIHVESTGDNASSQVEQNIQSSSTNTYTQNGSNSVSIHTSGGDTNQVTISNNDFKITGTISAYSGDSITVSNQKIMVDKGKVSNFSQTGDLTIGNKVTVEGKVISGILYAEKITAGGTTNSTPNPTTTNSININVNSSSTPFSTATNSATLPDSAVLGAQTNAIQQLIHSLENLISQLKNMFKL